MHLLLALLAGPPAAPVDVLAFEVHSTGDQTLVGNIERMEADGALSMRDGKHIVGNDLVSIRRAIEPVPAPPGSGCLVLHNGDVIKAERITLKESRLVLETAAMKSGGPAEESGALRVPLTAASYVWLRPGDAIDRTRRASTLFARVRAADQVLLGNGDVVSGTIIAFDAHRSQGELSIDTGKERSTIDMNKVVVIALGNKLARARTPAGRYAHVVLLDGSRLSLTTPTIRDDLFSATTLYREVVRIPLAAVVSIDIYQGPAVYISDLKQPKYLYRSFLGEHFGWSADRNLENKPLTLKTRQGVQTFDKGVAVHGECALSYALDGQFRRFECVVGLDRRMGARGSVELQALVDGKPQKLGDGKPLTIETGPWNIKVDVQKANELTLKVLWGEGGNVGDYVDWCDSRLIR